MTDVFVVDAGSGNLTSVANAVWRAGGNPVLVSTPDEILRARCLVLPGVGAAGALLGNLRARHLDEALAEAVLQRGRPFLGICVGMQVLCERLFEFGEHRGFGWFRGDVVHLQEVVAEGERIPHMGWSLIATAAPAAATPLARLRGQPAVYFCHSYTLVAPDDDAIAARVSGGHPLIAAIARHNILATQFHPEKSQDAGRRIFEAFIDWKP